MHVIFDETFNDSDYSGDPHGNAAVPGRLAGVMDILRTEKRFAVEAPSPASRADLLTGHCECHVTAVEKAPARFAMASLAAGASIMAADLAMQGKTAFACVQPPGNRASRTSAKGHCTFSNLALGLLRLRSAGLIRSALVVDFDQHTGDGTTDVLRDWREARVFNPSGDTGADYLRCLERALETAPKVDILAVSAGFDDCSNNLGCKLTKEDYFIIGRLLKSYAIRLRHQRRYAVMEGGYDLPDLGGKVLAFCRGFA